MRPSLKTGTHKMLIFISLKRLIACRMMAQVFVSNLSVRDTSNIHNIFCLLSFCVNICRSESIIKSLMHITIKLTSFAWCRLCDCMGWQ